MADQSTKPSTLLVQKKESSDAQKDNSSNGNANSLEVGYKKKKNKKGGLSMFLSGALDDTPKKIVPPPLPTPKIEGPAWGGTKVSKGLSSLREIQNEQSKIKVNTPARNKDQFEDLSNGKSEGKLRLSSFLTSKPIPMVSSQTSQASDADKSTPPWAASGTPPSLSRPSLRDIQMQQVSTFVVGLDFLRMFLIAF